VHDQVRERLGEQERQDQEHGSRRQDDRHAPASRRQQHGRQERPEEQDAHHAVAIHNRLAEGAAARRGDQVKGKADVQNDHPKAHGYDQQREDVVQRVHPQRGDHVLEAKDAAEEQAKERRGQAAGQQDHPLRSKAGQRLHHAQHRQEPDCRQNQAVPEIPEHQPEHERKGDAQHGRRIEFPVPRDAVDRHQLLERP